jgi:hypothetical protein
MLPPLTIQKAQQFGARAIECVGVNVDAVDVLCEGHQTETIGEPVGKIVGAQVEAQAGGDEVKEKTGVAETHNAFTKFVEGGRGESEGDSYLHAFAEIEAFQGRLASMLRMLSTEGAHDAAEVIAKRRNRGVIADVEGGELLGKGIAIGVGKNPLGEIVGKTLSKKVVAAEGLKGVVEDGCVAALFESGKEFGEGTSREIPDAREIGGGEKLEASFDRDHRRISWKSFMTKAKRRGVPAQRYEFP